MTTNKRKEVQPESDITGNMAENGYRGHIIIIL